MVIQGVGMMRNWQVFTSGAALLAVMAVPASAAIYIKIPDLPGESSLANAGVEPDEIDNKVKQKLRVAVRKDAGDAHLDYLTITMENTASMEHSQSGDDEAEDSVANEATHVVQQRGSRAETKAGEHVGPVRWMAPESVQTSTRDAASGMASGKRQHKPLTVTKELDKASPTMARASTTGSTKFSNITLKRGTFMPPPEMEGPGKVVFATAMPGCTVGKRYPHVLVGEEGAKEVKLVNVSVAQCASEEFSLNYEQIKHTY